MDPSSTTGPRDEHAPPSRRTSTGRVHPLPFKSSTWDNSVPSKRRSVAEHRAPSQAQLVLEQKHRLREQREVERRQEWVKSEVRFLRTLHDKQLYINRLIEQSESGDSLYSSTRTPRASGGRVSTSGQLPLPPPNARARMVSRQDSDDRTSEDSSALLSHHPSVASIANSVMTTGVKGASRSDPGAQQRVRRKPGIKGNDEFYWCPYDFQMQRDMQKLLKDVPKDDARSLPPAGPSISKTPSSLALSSAPSTALGGPVFMDPVVNLPLSPTSIVTLTGTVSSLALDEGKGKRSGGTSSSASTTPSLAQQLEGRIKSMARQLKTMHKPQVKPVGNL